MDVMKIPSQLFDSEKVFFKEIAERVVVEFVPAITITNIGIWMGSSCACFRAGAPEAKIVGVDVMGTYSVSQEVMDFINFERVIKRNSNYVDFDIPTHLLFIDGGHEYEVVKNDVRIYCSLVHVGGYTVFHDSRRPEVGPAIRETISEDPKWEDVSDRRVGTLQWFRRIG